MTESTLSVARPVSLDRLRVALNLRNLPLLAGLALVAAALLGLLYLAQTSGLAITGYDIQQLEAERARWQRHNDQLRLQIAEAKSLDTVEREARSRLGMRPPERVVFVRPAAPVAPSPAQTAEDPGTPAEAIQRLVSSVRGWLPAGY